VTVAQLITVEGVGRRFLTTSGIVEALRDVSLFVTEGEFCTIIGPSGCGKSTLLGMLGGLIAPDAGRVLIGGKPVTGPDPRAVATVFQDPGLFPWRTVVENIEFGLELQGVDRQTRRRVATELLGPLGLRDFALKYPRELSGGMRQRVEIARALAADPDIIYMDEPFGALDFLTRLKMRGDLIRIWQQERKTVIFVTHDIDEAVQLADRVVAFGPRPTSVRAVVPIAQPRPRDPNAPEYLETRRKILASMGMADGMRPV